MKVDIFDFNLPEERIANEPANPRDSAKLLYINGQKLNDFTIRNLPDLLKPSDILVFNDTKVIPARIYGKRGDAAIEATLLKQIDLFTWKCLIKNARRLKVGQQIDFSENFTALVKSKDEDGPVESDKANYQTIFAKNEGAVAAPTAGLHFTPELFDVFDKKGIQKEFVTLHVGGGTFLPVKVEDTKDHKMHSEYGIISKEVADKLNKAKSEGRRIIPVGTTALRLIESAADDNGVDMGRWKQRIDAAGTKGNKNPSQKRRQEIGHLFCFQTDGKGSQ